MNIRIASSKLARQLAQGTLDRKFGPGVAASFEQFVALVLSVPHEAALYGFTGLRVEQLQGDTEERSARLNRQFRVIFTIEKHTGGNTLVIDRIVDYH